MSEDKEKRELHGYEKMLDRVREFMDRAEKETGPRLRKAIEDAKERTIELGELTRDEAEKIAEYIRRDVEDAADYTSRTDADLGAWLRMDLQLVENWIWDRFSSVADRTRLEWVELQHELAEREFYHTGEIAAPGVLTCDNCGEQLHYKKAGHIPPCPKCNGTRFRRPEPES
ncbi:zinc ribbon-containing protein [Ectothiorhodospiraceae bacterium WFHF3C12]|nr:zinc ribbon-containing protein [Ectothiorhodospiraceae bacterium WFHF3C12]